MVKLDQIEINFVLFQIAIKRHPDSLWTQPRTHKHPLGVSHGNVSMVGQEQHTGKVGPFIK